SRLSRFRIFWSATLKLLVSRPWSGIWLVISLHSVDSVVTAAPPLRRQSPARAHLSAAAGSVILFAPGLLARRRRLVRLGCRLVGIVVEFDRAIGHQHLAVGVFEVRFGERRRRLARTALVGVPRQRLAALEIEVIGRAIDRHPGADLIGE